MQIKLLDNITLEFNENQLILTFSSSVAENTQPNPEFTYPMWFKSKGSGITVKFDSLNSGQVVAKPEDSNSPCGIGHISSAWTPHTNTMTWEQVEKPKSEFTYPMWFKSKDSGIIVRFDSLDFGEVVVKPKNARSPWNVGHKSSAWMPHTDTDLWEQVEEPTNSESTNSGLTLEEALIEMLKGNKITADRWGNEYLKWDFKNHRIVDGSGEEMRIYRFWYLVSEENNLKVMKD